MPKKRSVQLKLDRFLSASEPDALKRARFAGTLLLDTRSIVQAFAEFEPLESNVYTYRTRAEVDETDLPLCVCSGGMPTEMLCCGSACENRSMQVECVRGHCATGLDCSNQRFQRGSSVRLLLDQRGGKGIGLIADQFIEREQFVIEYTGEVIKRGDYYQRYEHLYGTRNYYGVQLNDIEVIDATTKGSLARFANHSCDPNCRLERWDVNGEVCCGLFAESFIERGDEITFSYAETRMKNQRSCLCGSQNCRGFVPK